MPLVRKGSSGVSQLQPSAAQYQVKIVGGRRVLIWKDRDNDLQQPQPPTRSVAQLRSQTDVDPTLATQFPPSGGAHSQFPPVSPADNPHWVPAARLVKAPQEKIAPQPPPPTGPVAQLRSQTDVDPTPATQLPSGGGGAQSQFPPVSPVDNPHWIPAARLMKAPQEKIAPQPPPPTGPVAQLRGQTDVDPTSATQLPPSGGGAQSQFPPVSLADNPHWVPAARLVKTPQGKVAPQPPQPRAGDAPRTEGQASVPAVRQGVVVTEQQPVNSQTASRRSSDLANGGLNSAVVLPPIGNADSNPAGSSTRRRKLGELENITLKNEIYRNAGLIHERRIQLILNGMRTLDRDRDGVLEPIQVKRILHKHQLTFGPEVDENLLLKFEETPRTVRYEQLIQYLSSVKLEASRTISQPSIVAQPTMPGPPRPGRAFTERDEIRLRDDLRDYMRPRLLDLDLVTRTLNDTDRDRNGFLSFAQVEAALQRSGLSDMPTELKQRLCTAADKQGNGLCNIDRLTAYMERAQPSFSRVGGIQGLGTNHHPRAPKQPSSVNIASKPPATIYRPQLSDQPPALDPDAAPPDRLVDPAPYDTVYPPSPPAPAFDSESWQRDYQHLVNTLYQNDEDNSGYMTVDRVGRITETFNTVYNLGITMDLVNRAMAQATESSYGMIQLSVYADTLMRLHLNAV